MSRAVAEWIADHDDQAIPRLVKARVWAKYDGRCAITNKKLTPADGPEIDHIVALIDGGEHRESNLQLIGAKAHKNKTAGEAERRKKERRNHAKHFGYWQRSGQKIAAHVDPWGKQRRMAAQDGSGTREGSKRAAHGRPNTNTSPVQKAPQ